MNNHIAFLSEWGSDELDFGRKDKNAPSISTHFIVAALTMPKQNVPEAQRILAAIQQRHFQGSAIQSERIDNNHDLRKVILEDLLEAPFQIFALVVDKRQLRGEGLRYKGSFYKFLPCYK